MFSSVERPRSTLASLDVDRGHFSADTLPTRRALQHRATESSPNCGNFRTAASAANKIRPRFAQANASTVFGDQLFGRTAASVTIPHTKSDPFEFARILRPLQRRERRSCGL